MTFDTSRPDVIVIGAGAAGISAARELRARGLCCLLLDARERLGGRAHTAACGTPYQLDLGCEWLHSADRNVLAELAPRCGFVLDKRDPPWSRRAPQRGLGEAELDRFAAEQGAFWDRLDEAGAEARLTGRDRAAAELLDPQGRYNGILDAISTYYNGAPLERVSVIDFDRYTDTGVNWRVEGGYGAMIAALGAGLPVRLGCRVSRVDARGRMIRVETDRGSFETAGVVVTVPTSVLASGAIGFDPILEDHLHAAAGLPLGVANKLFLRLDEPDAFEPDTRLTGSPGRRDIGSYTLRSGGRALVEGYFGGDYARHLEAGGLAAFVEAAKRDMTDAYGHDLSDKLTPVVATGWAGDPLSMGSYSHALPGHAEARAALARPYENRIWFAGEATSPHFFSTAHGAWEEGARAACALAACFAPCGS